MNEEEARAAREYLNRLSAGQDEKIAALKEQLAKLQAEHGTFTLEQAEERLEKRTQNDGIERRAREEAKTRRDEAEREVHREEYERLLEQQREVEDEAEAILDKYLQKQVELKELRARVVNEGRAAGLNYVTPDAVPLSDMVFEKVRSWEGRL
jgi:DNA mismatch repair ATPase MutS